MDPERTLRHDVLFLEPRLRDGAASASIEDVQELLA
jgi:hypothetical protein